MKALFKTKFGMMEAITDENFRLIELKFSDSLKEEILQDDLDRIKRLVKSIDENTTLDHVEFVGTKFQVNVWKEIQSIPYGRTISYKDLSVKVVGNTKSARAVASACSKNKIAILVPCHRVVKSNGEIGKYRWGIERKKLLLEYERTRTSS